MKRILIDRDSLQGRQHRRVAGWERSGLHQVERFDRDRYRGTVFEVRVGVVADYQ
jgi:hypothetical protein